MVENILASNIHESVQQILAHLPSKTTSFISKHDQEKRSSQNKFNIETRIKRRNLSVHLDVSIVTLYK